MQIRSYIHKIARIAIKRSAVYTHWLILLCILAVFFASGLLWGGYSLWRAYSGEFLLTTGNDPIPNVISRDKVQQTLESYHERRLRFERAFREEVPRDPSR